MPRISIIIPSYNRADVVADAIGSVVAQTYSDFEIIVVDDGSTDGTQCSRLESLDHRVRYVRQDNRGASAARNHGIAVSSGSYLLFLDSDDVLHENALEELARALDEHPECGAAYCGFVITSGRDEVESRSPLDRPSGEIFRRMCVEHLCISHSVMVRREVVDLSGGFDERLRQFEDWDFWIRVAAETSFVFVPKHLVEYRRWADGASGNRANLARHGKMLLRRYRAYYDRSMLSASEWQSVQYRFRGQYRDKWTALAFTNYEQRDYCRCVTCAFMGFITWPESLLNRGVWSIIAKSLARQLGAVRSRRRR